MNWLDGLAPLIYKEVCSFNDNHMISLQKGGNMRHSSLQKIFLTLLLGLLIPMTGVAADTIKIGVAGRHSHPGGSQTGSRTGQCCRRREWQTG